MDESWIIEWIRSVFGKIIQIRQEIWWDVDLLWKNSYDEGLKASIGDFLWIKMVVY